AGVRGGRVVALVIRVDALFDLAGEVGAVVCRLGEAAPAHTHEHGEKSRTEPESLEDDGGVSLVEEDDDRRAEKTEADGDHSGHASGAEGDTHGSTVGSVVTSACGGRYTDVASDRQPHADESGRCGEQCAKGEEDRSTDADRKVVRRQQEQQEWDDDDKDHKGAELPFEVGPSSFLNCDCDVAHSLCALLCGEDLTYQHPGHGESKECHRHDDDDESEVDAFQW